MHWRGFDAVYDDNDKWEWHVKNNVDDDNNNIDNNVDDDDASMINDGHKYDSNNNSTMSSFLFQIFISHSDNIHQQKSIKSIEKY